jgi:hypothetical protein
MALRLTVQVQLVLQALLRGPATEMYGLELSEETGLQPGTAYPILLRLRRGRRRRMMPDTDREERRKKRAPVISSVICGALAVTVLVQLLSPGWRWLPLAVGIAAATAVGVSIDPPGRPARRSAATCCPRPGWQR